MKNLILFILVLGMANAALAQNDREYFKGGIESSSLVRCGLRLAIDKIKTRGVGGPISLKGSVNHAEMDRNYGWENFEEHNKVARTYIDFNGTIGTMPINGSIVIFAQKKQDQLGRLTGGVLCKLSGHSQLRTKTQRRFILMDTASGFEID